MRDRSSLISARSSSIRLPGENPLRPQTDQPEGLGVTAEGLAEEAFAEEEPGLFDEPAEAFAEP